MKDQAVKVEGLAELRRNLKKLEPELQKELRAEFLVIGQDIANEARSKVPQVSGKAARSIRAGMSGNKAYVAGGKKTVPYYGWLDFGSRTPRRGNSRRQGPWKRSGTGPRDGRFIYKTLKQNRKEIRRAVLQTFEKAKTRALKSNGPRSGE